MAKKEGIIKLFDNIAPDYDKLDHILSLNIDKGWRKRAVREIVDTDKPMNVLDVACGTADFTIEIAQKLAPGGKLVILELSVPSNAFVRWWYKLYFLKILPTIGGLVSGNRGAYEYLPSSVLRFPAPDKFVEMMKSAGFAIVEHTPMTFGICRIYVGKKA